MGGWAFYFRALVVLSVGGARAQQGTLNMLGLAKRVKARMLLTSTSEVYGDPEVHPQVETYWGNVRALALGSWLLALAGSWWAAGGV